MTAAQLAAAKGPVIQVPVDLGGVAISYNESCAGAGLHLTGAQIAGIYLGTITNWNQLNAACPTYRRGRAGVPRRHLGTRLRP